MRRRKGAVVTARDRELFALLARARWLSTTQIRTRFFADKSASAVNKRMRKLVRAGLLRAARRGQMEELFFRLTMGARQFVQDESLILPKTLPAHLPHFSAINDVRLWFEQHAGRESVELENFWAESELKQVQDRWSIVPDAVVVLDNKPAGVLAVEVDQGTENASWFTTKLRRYRDMRGFAAVLVFVGPGWLRLKALIKGLYGALPIAPPVLLADLNRLAGMSLVSKTFIDVSALGSGEELPLVSVLEKLACPEGVSCRQESSVGVTASDCGTSRSGHARVYAVVEEGGSAARRRGE